MSEPKGEKAQWEVPATDEELESVAGGTALGGQDVVVYGPNGQPYEDWLPAGETFEDLYPT